MKDKINACYYDGTIVPLPPHCKITCYYDGNIVPNLAEDEKHEQDIYPQQLSLFDERNYWCEYFNVNWKKCKGAGGNPNCLWWEDLSCMNFK